MTRIVQFSELGGPEKLQMVEQTIRPPKAGEAEVRVRATGVNRAELLFLAGQYLASPNPPAGIGMEGAGVVTAVGPDVEDLKVGAEVMITPSMDPSQYGVLGENVIVPVSSLMAKPSSLDFRTAAAIWMAYPTAFGGLVNAGKLRRGAGQTVVIPAASSSVGLAAIQIVKNYGGVSIACTRSKSKAGRLLEAGADHVIATDDENVVERVHEITGGKGFDIAFDPVSGPFLTTLAQCTARGATIVEYGLLAGELPVLPLFDTFTKSVNYTTFHVAADLLHHPELHATAAKELMADLESGAYKPIIDRVFPFDQFQQAYAYLASNEQFGKVVIELSDS